MSLGSRGSVLPQPGGRTHSDTGHGGRPDPVEWSELQRLCGQDWEVRGSTMRVLDTGGAGPVLVFLHGNPTSSFLWRHVINELMGRFRCVAVDLIGMGRSGKPEIDYGWADHRAFLGEVLDRLRLDRPQQGVWLVMHDWGVGLGLQYARTHPGRIAGVALMEGHLRPLSSWSEFDEDGRALFQVLRTPGAGRKMIEDDNYFLDTVLPGGVARALHPSELAGYTEPFPTPASRRPIWRWVTQVPVAGDPPDVAQVLEDNAGWLAEAAVPGLLLWATPGAVIGPDRAAELRTTHPGLQVTHVGAGRHFLPEDQPDAIAGALTTWVTSSASPAVARAAGVAPD